MEENKDLQNEAIEPNETTETVKKVKIIAPNDPTNGAKVLRFPRDGRKKPIDIVSDQVLKVGENQDITEDEATRLMNYKGWKVEEIKEGKE